MGKPDSSAPCSTPDVAWLICSSASFIESSARRITTAAGGLADLTTAAGWLDESGIAVDDLGLARPSLDDVFLSLTGRRTESDDNEQEPGQ